MKRNSFSIALLAAGMSLGFLNATTVAGTLTLLDQNSSVTIDPYGQDGVNSWMVDGQNQLSQQWFWYRTGETGAASPIDTLGNAMVSGTNANTYAATLSYSSTNIGLSIQTKFGLTGVPSPGGQSNLTETITITNTSPGAQTIDFFQYSNFVLQGGSDGNTITFPDVNDVQQSNGVSSLSETTVNPSSTYYEANSPSNLLGEITGAGFGHLANLTTGPVQSPFQAADVAWAYEWDLSIPAGQSRIISKDLQLEVVPEPSTLALLLSAGLGLIGWAWRRRRV